MPLDSPNAKQFSRRRFPLEGQEPNTIYYRADNKNEITIYIQYDEYGKAVKRVDMQGAAHRGVKTPHAIDCGRNFYTPNGIRVQTPGSRFVRKPRPDELQYFKPDKNYLSEHDFIKLNTKHDFKFDFRPNSDFTSKSIK